jgi:hypothetical protein
MGRAALVVTDVHSPAACADIPDFCVRNIGPLKIIQFSSRAAPDRRISDDDVRPFARTAYAPHLRPSPARARGAHGCQVSGPQPRHPVQRSTGHLSRIPDSSMISALPLLRTLFYGKSAHTKQIQSNSFRLFRCST